MNLSPTFPKLKIGLIVMAIFSLFLIAGFTENSYAQNKKELCRGANLTFSDDPNPSTPINCATDAAGTAQDPQGDVNSLISAIINIFSVIVGIVAVIMVIVGGFKFITSGGDSNKVTSARNTIIYAIIGLIVVALAQFIVKFVLIKLPT